MNIKQGLFHNKKGGEKWLSIWWIAVLAIILGGVLISTVRFRSALDISTLDAEVLAERVSGCLVDEGKLVFEPANKPDVFSLCGIKFSDAKDYFIGVEIYEADKCTSTGSGADCQMNCSIGNKFYYEPSSYLHGNLKERCTTLASFQTKQMPSCAYKEIYTLGNDGKDYILKIIGATNEG